MEGDEEEAPLTGRDKEKPLPSQQPSRLIYDADGGDDDHDGPGAVRLLDARPGGALLTSYIFHGSLCGGFFGLGIVLCMLGPTLLDLADQASGASVREVTLLFTSRSFAYLLGSMLGGYLLETMENTCAMLAAAMYLVAIGSAGLPLCNEVWSMGCFMACAGLAMGLLDTGANVVTLRLWGSRAEPFVQSLHASFAVGALVAPLLAERFISQGLHSGGVAAACDEGHGTPSVWLDGGLRQPEQQSMPEQKEANVKWAFWISSLIMLPSAISLTVLTPRYARICRVSAAEAAAGDGSRSPPRKRSAGYHRRVLGLGLIIFGLYVGAEIGYGGYIFAFSVTSCDLQLSESRAAYLTATYWGTFTAGRVLAIPLSMVATPRTLTAMDIAGCLVASFAFYAFSGNEFVVWLSTGLFGLSLASVFPSTFTMLERYIPLSGRAASVIMVGSAAGEMIMPLIIGQAFEIVGPGTFPMIIALTSIIGCIVFVALLKVA